MSGVEAVTEVLPYTGLAFGLIASAGAFLRMRRTQTIATGVAMTIAVKDIFSLIIIGESHLSSVAWDMAGIATMLFTYWALSSRDANTNKLE